MKKFFLVLGVIFICLIVLGVILFSIAAKEGTKLDEESKAYVDRIVPSIVSAWGSKEFFNNASPELIKVVSSDKIDSMFQMFAEKLGKYKEYKGSKGDSDTHVNITPPSKTITAYYVAEADFEKASATIKIRIIKHGNNWQILEFFVYSDALMS